MKFNFEKFFSLAKAAGIEAAEVNYVAENSTEISVYKSEVDQFSVADSEAIGARGIVNGKFGAASTEKITAKTPAELVAAIVENARVNEDDQPAIIFKGSPKYKRKTTFKKELASVTTEEKINLLLEIEKKLAAYDPRISDVEAVGYSEETSERIKRNSYGVNLRSKANYFYIYGSVIVKQDEDVKSGYKIHLGNDLASVDVDKLVEEIAKNALAQLGGKPAKSGKYPVILNPSTTASLLNAFMGNANAENVQKQTSLFVGKLNEQVASKKVTIIENPLANNIFYTYFDSEGVATSKKTFVEKGILKSYAYNLGTAAKEGVETTGNAVGGGGKIGIGFRGLSIKPGKKSEEEIISTVSLGLYIKEVQGLHAGLNPQSGNFSLQANGFMIRDGKIAEPVNLITIAGNLVTLFKDVVLVGNNLELQPSSILTPSIKVKSLAISGE